jgi:glucan biosynthesis protein C
MTAPTPTIRRYDIDWLRVIAIWLLIVYHIGIGFQPWGVLIGFIQNDTPLKELEGLMYMMNIWRIPILFFVSGMGVAFAMRKRNWLALIKERARRILVPFFFGILTIVPLHILLWQHYYNQDLTYSPSPGHLWFLGNIFLYVLILLPLFSFLKSRPDSKLGQGIKNVVGRPVGLLIMVGAFMAEAIILNPEYFEMYALTAHGFWLGLLAFLFGYLIIFSGERFWQLVLRIRWLVLVAAVGLYGVRFGYYDLEAPKALMALESCMWIFAVFAFVYKYLNRPSKALSYLSQASYPVYILHMLFLYLASYFIFPLEIATSLKFVIVNVFTIVACYVTYEYVIRRVGVLRPWFGLKAPATPPPPRVSVPYS